ncbi:MAG: hypothetical protein KatS3mg118_0980 [Paracoccaceae bacterium]|nr:MAG: hypothetical protein KatS3mg118_0980 [Paracoccaceae bacterium]
MVAPRRASRYAFFTSARRPGRPRNRFILPLRTRVFTALTLTPNSASTACLICGLVASRRHLEHDRASFRGHGRLLGDHRTADDVVDARASCSFASRASSASMAGPGQHQLVPAQDVIDVRTLARQHVDAFEDCARRGAKFASTSAPSMISARDRPSFSHRSRSARVLRLADGRESSTTSPPAAAFADSAMLQAQRPHLLGQVMGMAARHRALGRAAVPELPRCGCRGGPAGALLAIHLARGVVHLGPALASCACRPDAWPAASAPRGAGCPRAAPARRSRRSAPPRRPLPASRVITSAFIPHPPPPEPAARRRTARFAGRRQRPAARAPFTASRSIVTQPPFDARHRTLDHDQATLGIGAHHLEVLRRHPHRAHVAGHLLALEHLARILAWPVEPWLRCEIDTPCWRAGRRNCAASSRRRSPCRSRSRPRRRTAPARNGRRSSSAPTSIRFSGLDPELDELALRRDLGLGEVAPHRLVVRSSAWRARAELEAA